MNIAQHFTRSRFAAAFASALLLSLALAGNAIAQDYPTKPITIIVTYPAGGGADLMARLLAPKMSATLMQSSRALNRLAGMRNFSCNPRTMRGLKCQPTTGSAQ